MLLDLVRGTTAVKDAEKFVLLASRSRASPQTPFIKNKEWKEHRRKTMTGRMTNEFLHATECPTPRPRLGALGFPCMEPVFCRFMRGDYVECGTS